MYVADVPPQINVAPCSFDTRPITGQGSSFAEREGIVDTLDHSGSGSGSNSNSSGSGSGGDSDSASVSHHCSSSYLGNVLDPVNNLNVR
jgi:hypothetical protein